MSIVITKKGYDGLKEELNRLITIDRPTISEVISENRPIGILGDNPEYLEALKTQAMIENKISSLTEVLNDATIYDESMKREGIVSFGATVTFNDCETDEEKVYTIVSMYESDVNNGLISYQAPFIKAMLGLTTDDFFDFNDKSYEITKIEYRDLATLLG